MAANGDLFEIAKAIRSSESLSYDVIVTPSKFLMAKLRADPSAAGVVGAIDEYLPRPKYTQPKSFQLPVCGLVSEIYTDRSRYLDYYGHQGYSMDFVEPVRFFPLFSVIFNRKMPFPVHLNKK